MDRDGLESEAKWTAFKAKCSHHTFFPHFEHARMVLLVPSRAMSSAGGKYRALFILLTFQVFLDPSRICIMIAPDGRKGTDVFISPNTTWA